MTQEAMSALKSTIQAFINERYQARRAKLKSNDPELASKSAALEKQHQFDAWIDNAVRRVGQLQVVTHISKATHPDVGAKASSLYCPTEELPRHTLVGSHTLNGAHNTDVVGNSAALDIYKFLRQSDGSQTLLARALADDPSLANALEGKDARGWERMRAFARITQRSSPLKTDYRLKQIYWLIDEDPADDAAYLLFTPLYSSVLAHRLYRQINEDRFGESAKQARQARRDGVAHSHGFRDYPDIAIQKIGGSNPQNVSQLNAERGSGRNYLLASLPPIWNTANRRPLLRTNSAWRIFARRPGVRRQIEALQTLLADNPPANVRVRRRRDDIVTALIDELIRFTGETNELEPGWSATADCWLDEAQIYWLDAARGALDEDFAARRAESDWPRRVRDQFAQWLNTQLMAFPVADPEHEHWSDQLKTHMDGIEEALPYV